MRPLYRPSEIILWALVLVLALYFGWRGRQEPNALSAHVYQEDHLIFSIELANEVAGTYELEEQPGFVLETNGEGAIRIKQSPCPDKLCMRVGYLEHPGEQAICLPLKLVLQLSGETEDEGFDAFIGSGEELLETGNYDAGDIEDLVESDNTDSESTADVAETNIIESGSTAESASKSTHNDSSEDTTSELKDRE